MSLFFSHSNVGAFSLKNSGVKAVVCFRKSNFDPQFKEVVILEGLLIIVKNPTGIPQTRKYILDL